MMAFEFDGGLDLLGGSRANDLSFYTAGQRMDR